MKLSVKNMVLTAMFASLTCVATMIIKVPSPLNGYINMGDCVVLLSGWLLPAPFAFLAAGIGSALADLFSGYASYALATFVIKGLMALIALYGAKLFAKGKCNVLSNVVSGFIAEIFMVSGYYLFEGVLYGFIPSLANVPANAVQGVAGLVLGILAFKVFQKAKI